MVTRTGPFIMAAEQWDEPYAATLERVDRHCRDVGAIALYYDAGGSGAGIRTNMRQMWRDRQLTQYPVFGVNFGAAVEGANTEFVRGQTNAQYFARRNSQLAWTLRKRLTVWGRVCTKGVRRIPVNRSAHQPREGGAAPTRTLQITGRVTQGDTKKRQEILEATVPGHASRDRQRKARGYSLLVLVARTRSSVSLICTGVAVSRIRSEGRRRGRPGKVPLV